MTKNKETKTIQKLKEMVSKQVGIPMDRIVVTKISDDCDEIDNVGDGVAAAAMPNPAKQYFYDNYIKYMPAEFIEAVGGTGDRNTFIYDKIKTIDASMTEMRVNMAITNTSTLFAAAISFWDGDKYVVAENQRLAFTNLVYNEFTKNADFIMTDMYENLRAFGRKIIGKKYTEDDTCFRRYNNPEDTNVLPYDAYSAFSFLTDLRSFYAPTENGEPGAIMIDGQLINMYAASLCSYLYMGICRHVQGMDADNEEVQRIIGEFNDNFADLAQYVLGCLYEIARLAVASVSNLKNIGIKPLGFAPNERRYNNRIHHDKNGISMNVPFSISEGF